MSSELRVTNKNARQYVQCTTPFTGSHTSGIWTLDRKKYVVYSYGWYPIFIWDRKNWYEVDDTYSPTTARHIYQLRPGKTIKKNVNDMRRLINGE